MYLCWAGLCVRACFLDGTTIYAAQPTSPLPLEFLSLASASARDDDGAGRLKTSPSQKWAKKTPPSLLLVPATRKSPASPHCRPVQISEFRRRNIFPPPVCPPFLSLQFRDPDSPPFPRVFTWRLAERSAQAQSSQWQSLLGTASFSLSASLPLAARALSQGPFRRGERERLGRPVSP